MSVVYYEIAVGKDRQSTLRGDGWTGYYKRLSLSLDGQLPEGEAVYGLAQCREHVAEIRETKGEYRKYWTTVPLAIVKVTVAREDVDAQPNHTTDADCAPFIVDDSCSTCGVFHGDPCPECQGRGFHKSECSEWYE